MLPVKNSQGAAPSDSTHWSAGLTVQSAEPASVEKVSFDDLTPIEQRALLEAEKRLGSAYPPQTMNHRAAGLGIEPLQDEKLFQRPGNEGFQSRTDAYVHPDRRYAVINHVNADSTHRGKSCAEHNALNLADAEFGPEEQPVRIAAIATISYRENSNGEHTSEDPVAPCGTCRTAYSGRWGTADNQPLVDGDTKLVMSSTDRQHILRVPLKDLMPLRYLTRGLNVDEIEQLALPSLVMLDRTELASRTFDLRRHGSAEHFAPASVPGSDIAKALDLAIDRASASRARFSGRQTGAATLAINAKLVGGSRRETAEPLTSISAPRSAIVNAQAQGTNLFSAIAIHEKGDPNGAEFHAPDGEARQLIFDRAQLAGVDIKVVISREGEQHVVICDASELFPLGEGPLDSRTTRKNLAHYRLLDGERLS